MRPETRTICRSLETEMRDTSKVPGIRGMAAVFWDGTEGTEFVLNDRFNVVERILPGAFDETLASDDDVVALRNHDSDLILGRRSAGNLELTVTSKGLEYRVQGPASGEDMTDLYRNTVADIRAGNLDGSSFQFFVEEEDWEERGNHQIRSIKSVKLVDVGPVTFPAYAATDADVRSILLDRGAQTPVLDAKLARLRQLDSSF